MPCFWFCPSISLGFCSFLCFPFFVGRFSCSRHWFVGFVFMSPSLTSHFSSFFQYCFLFVLRTTWYTNALFFSSRCFVFLCSLIVLDFCTHSFRPLFTSLVSFSFFSSVFFSIVLVFQVLLRFGCPLLLHRSLSSNLFDVVVFCLGDFFLSSIVIAIVVYFILVDLYVFVADDLQCLCFFPVVPSLFFNTLHTYAHTAVVTSNSSFFHGVWPGKSDNARPGVGRTCHRFSFLLSRLNVFCRICSFAPPKDPLHAGLVFSLIKLEFPYFSSTYTPSRLFDF